MTEAKPILTIKQKCNTLYKEEIKNSLQDWFGHPLVCKCTGTGTQTLEIYPLKDFEKCDDLNCFDGVLYCDKKDCKDKGECPGHTHKDCYKGYKIPFKDYEIKSVKQYWMESIGISLTTWESKYNLKEDDKVVVRVR